MPKLPGSERFLCYEELLSAESPKGHKWTDMDENTASEPARLRPS